MESPPFSRSPLADLEHAVMEEGREWMRQELQKRLQQLADTEGDVFPPQQPEPDEKTRA
jgi:hypothetical protein